MRRLMSLALVVGLAGCAVGPARPETEGGPYGSSAEPAPPPPVARTVLNTIGTPFYLVLKTAVCAATVAIAAPATAIYALSSSAYPQERLREGFEANCGPPYVLR